MKEEKKKKDKVKMVKQEERKKEANSDVARTATSNSFMVGCKKKKAQKYL